MSRTVICYDMDMYFAAVTIRDNPALKDKPLVIGSLPGERGVVSTASYEARKYSIHSGMSSYVVIIKKLVLLYLRNWSGSTDLSNN